MFKLVTDYPSAAAEQELLLRYHTGFDAHRLETAELRTVIGPGDREEIRREIRAVTVEEGIMRYITRIAHASRESRDLILGGSPRASITSLLAAKTSAALAGRDYVTPEDVKELVLPIYRHRIILRPEAEIEGLDPDTVMGYILDELQVPR